MDIKKNNCEMELISKDDAAWSSIDIKYEPAEYQSNYEEDSREVQNKLENLSNNINNGFSATEEYPFNKIPIIKLEKLHDCKKCRKVFQTAESLEVHLQTHVKLKPLACDICNKRYARKRDITNHLRIHNNLALKCDICSQQFLRPCALVNHKRTHIGQSLDIKTKFVTHISAKSNSPRKESDNKHSKPFSCDICSKGFSRRTYLNLHRRRHWYPREIPCVICERKFITNEELTAHMQTHKGENPYKCDICKAKFPDKKGLKCHIIAHIHDDGPYVCTICEKRFQRGYLLKVHIAGHINHKALPCPVCKYSFSRRSELASHMLFHENEKTFECEVCSKTFITMTFLKQHRKVHLERKAYTCDICQRKFIKKPVFNMHMRFHAGKMPFECDYCKRKFATRYRVEQHIISHVGDDGVNKCEICGTGFSMDEVLKRHLRLHSNFKPFECQQCRKSFFKAAELSEHLSTHLTSRPFVCDICGKDFTRKFYLNSHKKRHGQCPKQPTEFIQRIIPEETLPTQEVDTFTLSQTEKKPLECEICKKKFPDSYRMKLHMIAHTGDGGPNKCSVCGKGFSINYVLQIHMQGHKKKKPCDSVKRPFECDICKKKFRLEKNLKSHKLSHIKAEPIESPDGKIGFEESDSRSVRLKSEIKSEVQDEKDSNWEGGKSNLQKIPENGNFISNSVKAEPRDLLDLDHEINVGGVRIKVEADEIDEM